MIIEEIDESLFISRFEDYDRVKTAENGGNFTYKGLWALFNYLNDLSEDTGEPIKLDVISLCCDFSEYKDIEEYLKDYKGLTFEEFLKDNYPEDLNNYEKHKKESVKNGLDLSESLFNFIAYIQKDVYKIKEYNKQIEEEISEKTTLIKFSDDLDEGFIIQAY